VTIGDRSPARHERPIVDEAALVVARDADKLLDAARARGLQRWADFLEPLPGLFGDAPLKDLRRIAMRARAAYGPKDSIREALPADLTEPFLMNLDRLIKALNRDAMEGRL
jgi:hypothetical protein